MPTLTHPLRLVLNTNVVACRPCCGADRLACCCRQCETRVLLAELTDILGHPKFGKKIETSLLAVDQLVDHCAALRTLVWLTLG